MAIGIIATLKVQEGKNNEFEKAFSELAEKVLANEDGALFYALHRSQSDPQVYKVLEQYRTEADLNAHRETEYFKTIGGALGPMLAGAPEIETLDSV